ncbi:MAG: inorganic pyrophosphatase [Candidatus Obscuribacterales bacterium]|nr:inorganic pyrophosphatase [Candidatus Obscuribacterales bacterium]
MNAHDRLLAFEQSLSMLNRAHPWHGISPGAKAPTIVETYIEIVPTDVVKNEADKVSGYLRIDRPQRYSSKCPNPYGYIPQTYCGDKVAAYCQSKVSGRKKLKGDGDPLDICVLTECDIAHGDILMSVRPIGGLRMIDGGEVDDKIVAVLEGDAAFGHLRDIKDVPSGLIRRLKHYFLTYKLGPEQGCSNKVQIAAVYDRREAHQIIRLSMQDYVDKYGTPESRMIKLREMLAEGVIAELLKQGWLPPNGKKKPVKSRSKTTRTSKR